MIAVSALGGGVAEASASLERAMASVRAKDWAGALQQAQGRTEQDIILWHALRAGQGDAALVRDFLARNGDWPGLPYLKTRSEGTMAEAPARQILAFYQDHVPDTGTGALSLAGAQVETGNRRAAEQTVQQAWRSLRLTDEEHAAFLRDWGATLRSHHVARLDHVLWRGWLDNARAMLPLVDGGWQALARARIALRDDQNGVDGLIAAIPSGLAGDAGLAYERFRWRRDHGREDAAIALMQERSTSADSLGRPEVWAGARRVMARSKMRQGEVLLAYRMASAHGLTEGDDFADLEWLSGYLALRFLGRADLASRHFDRFTAAVDSPISLARGGYWQGRALEAQGNTAGARAAYARAAEYQTAYYGLLAAERAGLPFDDALRGGTRPNWRGASFTRSSVHDAALLLLESGQNMLGERFLTHLSEGKDRAEIERMGAMLEEMNRPHIQVMLGKRAAQFGMQIPGPYYAVDPMVVNGRYPVDKALVLAIARRESEFDPSVISPVGARGYMQLMPRTAQAMAQKTGQSYSADRLLSDPAYNASLGAAYLAQVSEQFGGNVVLMSAAYNAGPSRPERWMQLFGDPRAGRVDVVDWIEFIPFDETRNYVMRVAESLPVYRARLGRDPHPVPFSQELAGATLR